VQFLLENRANTMTDTLRITQLESQVQRLQTDNRLLESKLANAASTAGVLLSFAEAVGHILRRHAATVSPAFRAELADLLKRTGAALGTHIDPGRAATFHRLASVASADLEATK
jgi:hypothetical protein